MDIKLYYLYGNYFNGYFIVNHRLLHNFITNKCGGDQEKAKKKIRRYWLWLLLPIVGTIPMFIALENIGLQTC